MNVNRITGHLILVMAPMASGKGSLVSYIKHEFPMITLLTSCTTRSMRPGEADGKEYYFLSRDEFTTRIAQGDFIEYAEFSGNLYGTLKSELVTRLQSGEVVLNEIELQGVQRLMSVLPKENRTLLYVDAGDWETLKARALARAPISEEDLKLRYERYLEEDGFKGNADFIIKNNDGQLEQAKAQIHKIIDDIILNKAAKI